MRLLAMSLFAGLMLTACSADPIKYVKITKVYQSLPPREGASCAPQVFLAKEAVTRSYEIVCELRSNTGTGLLDPRDLNQAVQQSIPQACECGGDALFVESFKDTRMTYSTAIEAEIKVIKFKDGN